MKVYFKNLNSIRFIAASLVIIHHIELLKWLNGLPNAHDSKIIFLFGKLGVDIFFVLSGFLITALLFIEKETFGKIDIKKFYLRRVLRIWPLYFLIIILAVWVLPNIINLRIPQWYNPNDNLGANLFLLFFFLPNLQIFLFGPIPYAAQTWSIGVEEQFYILWPYLISRIKNMDVLKKVFIYFLVSFVLLRLTLIVLSKMFHIEALNSIAAFMSDRFQIDCMLIGGIFSLFYYKKSYFKLLTSKLVQVASYIFVLVFLILGMTFKNFFWEIYGVLFGIIIYNLVNVETSLLNLNNKILDYLGKISYGLYMFHTLIINVVIRYISTNNYVIYGLSFLLSIAISALSYEYFEKFFLKYKAKFEKIKTI